MSITLRLSEAFNQYRDRPAITDQNGKRTLTYGELDELCGRAAWKIQNLGIRTGDCVAVNMGRRTEYIIAQLAILRIGAVMIPLIPEYPKERVEYIRKDADLKLIIGEDFFRELPEAEDIELPPWRDNPEDMKEFIFYTSGSTGNPKGIIYRDKAVMAGIERGFQEGILDAEPLVCIGFATLTFTASNGDYCRNLLAGGHVHMLSDEVRMDVEKLEEYLEKAGVTFAFIPPRMLRAYQNRDKSLQVVSTAGEKVSGVYSPDFKIRNLLGMTETIFPYCAFTIDKKYENTPVGKPLGDVTIRLVDEEWNEVPAGEEGVIVPTGTFPYEYNNLPEETAKTFHVEPDGRVSIYTGDVGRMLPDGNLLYVNRADWMMKIHGQRVEPGEIESAMKEVPGVRDAIAKAFEQEDGSMLLCGFYTVSAPVDKETVREALVRKLPHYMIPSVLVQMDSFPVNPNGKTDRKAIQCPDRSELLTQYEEPVGQVESTLAKAMSSLLHLPKIGRNDNFLELGGNSMNAHLLAQACGIEGVTPQLIMLGKTSAKIAALLTGQNQRPRIKFHAGKRQRYPISLAQHYQYDVCASLGKNMNLYDMVLYYELDHELDTEKLKKAIEQTVLEYPVYRTRINISEKWMEVNSFFQVRELSFSEEEFRAFREERLSEERNFTGDPKKDAPLFDAAIIHSGGRSFLFLDLCHIIYDGTGMKLFMDTVSSKMKGEAEVKEQYSLLDVAVFEQSIRNTPFFKKAWKFYDTYYQGLDQEDSFFREEDHYDVRLEKPLLTDTTREKLDSFLKRTGISILTLFQGALELTVRKLTDRADFAYMNVYDGRTSAELEHTQGVLAKAVFVRSSARQDQTVREYLAGVQEGYQQLVYHDMIDTPELIQKHPHIRSGICLNFRTVPGSFHLDGKELKPDGAYVQELLKAHKALAVFDLGIDNSQDGKEHIGRIVSSKVSPESAREFLEAYDGLLKKLMEAESMEEILSDAGQ